MRLSRESEPHLSITHVPNQVLAMRRVGHVPQGDGHVSVLPMSLRCWPCGSRGRANPTSPSDLFLRSLSRCVSTLSFQVCIHSQSALSVYPRPEFPRCVSTPRVT